MSRAEVTLRTAEPGDRDRVLEWSNEPGTRAASFRNEPIGKAEHAAWFAASLAGARQLYIAESHATPIGLARLDPLDAETAEVGLVLAAEWRGRGLALPVLAALSDTASRSGLKRLVARVRNDNPRSLRTFERAGYRRDGDETVSATAAARYVLELGGGEAKQA